MTQREQKIHTLVTDLRRVLDGKRAVTLMAAGGGLDIGALHVSEAVRHCKAAAREASQAVREAGGSDEDCRRASAEAWRNNLPELDVLGNIRGFIGAVAAGVKAGYIAAPAARLLLYTAQLQLAAMRGRLQ